MKFGLLYIPDYYPDRYPSASHFYGDMIEEIQFAEQLGFEGAFFAEHYIDGYAFPSPPVFATAVAQRTERIRLGTGVTLLPLSNPIRTAEEYAMLDVLSEGRLDFGVGRGILKAEYELFGIDEAESQGRYHEALDVVLQAWTQESVTHSGEYYRVQDVKAFPKPVQQPHPPIWAACAVTPGSFSWAGQRGLHPMIVPFAFPDHRRLQKLLDRYWSAHREAGHESSGREVLGVYHLYVDQTDERAHAVGRPHFGRYWEFFSALDRKGSFQSDDYDVYRGGFGKIFGNVTYEDLDRGDCVMFGTPERVTERLRRAREDYGLTYPIFEVNFGALPHAQAMESLELFAKEVIPQFDAAQAS